MILLMEILSRRSYTKWEKIATSGVEFKDYDYINVAKTFGVDGIVILLWII